VELNLEWIFLSFLLPFTFLSFIFCLFFYFFLLLFSFRMDFFCYVYLFMPNPCIRKGTVSSVWRDLCLVLLDTIGLWKCYCRVVSLIFFFISIFLLSTFQFLLNILYGLLHNFHTLNFFHFKLTQYFINYWFHLDIFQFNFISLLFLFRFYCQCFH